MTDAYGVVHISPLINGDSITIEVMENGYNDFSQVVTVTNMATYNIALNPIVSNSYLYQGNFLVFSCICEKNSSVSEYKHEIDCNMGS